MYEQADDHSLSIMCVLTYTLCASCVHAGMPCVYLCIYVKMYL